MTPELRAWVVALAKERGTVDGIAIALDLTRDEVLRVLWAEKIRPNDPPPPSETARRRENER